MKLVFPFLIVFLLAGNTAFCQNPTAQGAATQPSQTQTIEGRSEAITASMVKNLRLNPAQAEKVRQINLNSMQLVEALRLEYKTNPNQLNQEVKTISSSRLAQLKDVLSPAQFSAYQQRRESKMGMPKQTESQNH